MRSRLLAWTLTSALALGSCDAEKPQPDDPTGATTANKIPLSAKEAFTATTTAATATTAATMAKADAPVTQKKGLKALGNDAEVVKQIQKVRDGCKWHGNNFVGACKLLHEWVEWASWPGRRDIKPTLVAILEDENPAVIHVAALGLEVIGTRPISDPNMATALFDALEKERNPNNCRGITIQAAAVKLKETGLDERAKKVVRTHPISKCRSEFVGAFLYYNSHHYDLVVHLAKTDKDPKVRAEAMKGMRDGARKDRERQRNNCKLWIALLDESGQDHTASAVEFIGGTGVRASGEPCVDEWDEMLKKIEAMAGAGKARSTKVPWGMCAMLEQKMATKEQKAKALSVAKKIVETTANGQASRATALRCIGRHDPDAEAFAKKLEQDASEKVKKAAKQILDAAPKSSPKNGPPADGGS